MKEFFIVLTLLFFVRLAPAQYLHQQGKYIVDGDGNEFITRSMGLGGWMLQEGYMLGTGGFAGTQHEIRALIEESMGKERTDEFYDAWLANHCTKTDIDSLAAWGFNAVRPALHYNLFTLPIEEEPVAGQDTWLEPGFRMVDELLAWCKAHEMYVILDLHAAPGGQGKNADISDYDPSKPSLWESEENQRKTVTLWKKLAERYANEKYIGGYDLINETNWNFNGTHQNGCDSSNEILRALMIRITNAIREVDRNHLIFIEGNCWSNNMNGMFPPWDDNMAYSFHKYWNGTGKNTINEFIGWRDQYNVPIWMGESGENSNQWFYETIRTLEANKIGWSWWPLKKIGSVVGPLTAVQTPEYSQLLDTWRNGGTPEANFCYNTLMQITENLKIENCEFHPDVIDAMFRQQTENTAIPYKKHEIPGVIQAEDFDMGRHDVAYHDQDFINTTGNAGGAAWNNGHVYRNDGADIEKSEDDNTLSNGYNLGWINTGEWLIFTADVKETGAYKVTFRVAGSGGAGKLHLEVDQKNLTPVVSVPATAGNQKWVDLTVENVILEKGTKKIKLYFDNGGFNLNYIRFSDPGPTSSVPTKAMNGYGSPDGSAVFLAINKKFDQSVEPSATNFRLKVNGFLENISEIRYDTEDRGKLTLTPEKKKLKPGDEAFLSYIPGNLKSEDQVMLEVFSNLKIDTKNILNIHEIPGQIEAESFLVNEGLSIENCSDEGGGFDMGYTDDGDYLDYRVNISVAGNYAVVYRVASGNAAGGTIDLQLINAEDHVQTLQSVSVPATGAWQNWISITRNVDLPAGEYTLRMLVSKREFNLNWMKFTLLQATGTNDLQYKTEWFTLYPNPANDKLFIDLLPKFDFSFNLKIIDLSGRVLRTETELKNTGPITIGLENIKSGLYFLQLTTSQGNFSKPFIISNKNN